MELNVTREWLDRAIQAEEESGGYCEAGAPLSEWLAVCEPIVRAGDVMRFSVELLDDVFKQPQDPIANPHTVFVEVSHIVYNEDGTKDVWLKRK